MKKLLFVLVIGAFTACACETKEVKTDSAVAAIDSAVVTLDSAAAKVDSAVVKLDSAIKK